MGAVVVVALTRTVRGLTSEFRLGVEDGLPEACVASFDNIHTLRRGAFRRRICRLSDERMGQACRILDAAVGCV
jgi:mRNA interferase MazF